MWAGKGSTRKESKSSEAQLARDKGQKEILQIHFRVKGGSRETSGWSGAWKGKQAVDVLCPEVWSVHCFIDSCY